MEIFVFKYLKIIFKENVKQKECKTLNTHIYTRRKEQKHGADGHTILKSDLDLVGECSRSEAASNGSRSCR